MANATRSIYDHLGAGLGEAKKALDDYYNHLHVRADNVTDPTTPHPNSTPQTSATILRAKAVHQKICRLYQECIDLENQKPQDNAHYDTLEYTVNEERYHVEKKEALKYYLTAQKALKDLSNRHEALRIQEEIIEENKTKKARTILEILGTMLGLACLTLGGLHIIGLTAATIGCIAACAIYNFFIPKAISTKFPKTDFLLSIGKIMGLAIGVVYGALAYYSVAVIHPGVLALIIPLAIASFMSNWILNRNEVVKAINEMAGAFREFHAKHKGHYLKHLIKNLKSKPGTTISTILTRALTVILAATTTAVFTAGGLYSLASLPVFGFASIGAAFAASPLFFGVMAVMFVATTYLFMQRAMTKIANRFIDDVIPIFNGNHETKHKWIEEKLEKLERDGLIPEEIKTTLKKKYTGFEGVIRFIFNIEGDSAKEWTRKIIFSKFTAFFLIGAFVGYWGQHPVIHRFMTYLPINGTLAWGTMSFSLAARCSMIADRLETIVGPLLSKQFYKDLYTQKMKSAFNALRSIQLSSFHPRNIAAKFTSLDHWITKKAKVHVDRNGYIFEDNPKFDLHTNSFTHKAARYANFTRSAYKLRTPSDDWEQKSWIKKAYAKTKISVVMFSDIVGGIGSWILNGFANGYLTLWGLEPGASPFSKGGHWLTGTGVSLVVIGESTRQYLDTKYGANPDNQLKKTSESMLARYRNGREESLNEDGSVDKKGILGALQFFQAGKLDEKSGRRTVIQSPQPQA